MMLWVTASAVLWVALLLVVLGLCRAAAAGDAGQPGIMGDRRRMPARRRASAS